MSGAEILLEPGVFPRLLQGSTNSGSGFAPSSGSIASLADDIPE